ncbi:MAG TPA: serine/threonine-protein kinase [Opitutaceae bacterium]|nr:serine/threonine-protein kinase [Opitutaceae bacterium]
MPDVPASGRAFAEAVGPVLAAPGEPAPLAGIACCADLPEREGLGPPLEEEFAAGHLLDGRFLILEPIGRSATATIYRAEDRAHGGRSVAVKVLLRRIESDPVSFGRFEREARIGEALDDPRLLRFIPAPGPKSRPYFVTEFVDGCTLALVLHLTRPVPEGDALRIASAVCGALGRMHADGFIHRDIKPANVMVRRDGTLCLMDFGLAAEIDKGPGILAGLTPLFGTPEYMAPEQVRNRRNDQRTDIYSLGVILFQMLTGVLPFVDLDPWAAAQMRVTGDPVAPRSLNPAITPEAQEIVLRAMRRNPDERYQTAAEFHAALDAPERVHVTGLSGRLKAPSWRLSLHGTPLLSGALIGAGVLLMLVGLFLVISRHR